MTSFINRSATYTATGQWRAVAYALVPGIRLRQTGVQASSQWAELVLYPNLPSYVTSSVNIRFLSSSVSGIFDEDLCLI